MKLRSFRMLIAAALAACGGCSTYHEARSSLPANAADRLTMRVEEAQRAEHEAAGCAQELLQVGQVGPGEALDRLDVRARELNRRVLAAEDVAVANPETDGPEVRRLRNRTDELSKAVSAARESDSSARERLGRWVTQTPEKEKGRG